MAMIDRTIESMPKRIEKIITSKGKRIKYRKIYLAVRNYMMQNTLCKLMDYCKRNYGIVISSMNKLYK